MSPRLERWSVAYGSLVGEIYGDLRFPDGERIITSRLKALDFEAMEAWTVSGTKYLLGEAQGPGKIYVAKSEEIENAKEKA